MLQPSSTMPNASSAANQCPSELLSLICAHIFAAGEPPSASSLDPLVQAEDLTPTSQPSSYPAAHWAEPVVRKTLANACLVSHAWYEAAKPWLWQKVEVRLPRSWMALVEELAGGDEDISDTQPTAFFVGQTIQDVEDAAAAAQSLVEGRRDSVDDLVRELHGKLLATLTGLDGHIPPELLSPPATRDPSPRRIRAKSKSPGRWKIMRTIEDAMLNVVEQNHPGVYSMCPLLFTRRRRFYSWSLLNSTPATRPSSRSVRSPPGLHALPYHRHEKIPRGRYFRPFRHSRAAACSPQSTRKKLYTCPE